VLGATPIVVNAAAVTVKVAEPLIEPEVAVIVVVPCAMLVANPVWSLIVATEVLEEVQLAVVVRSCVVPLV
jgi:hypothetical protein